MHLAGYGIRATSSALSLSQLKGVTVRPEVRRLLRLSIRSKDWQTVHAAKGPSFRNKPPTCRETDGKASTRTGRHTERETMGRWGKAGPYATPVHKLHLRMYCMSIHCHTIYLCPIQKSFRMVTALFNALMHLGENVSIEIRGLFYQHCVYEVQ